MHRLPAFLSIVKCFIPIIAEIFVSTIFLDYTAGSVWIVLFLSPLLLHLISHELFHALAFRARIVVSVALQEVDNAPNAKTCSESDNECLQNAYN